MRSSAAINQALASGQGVELHKKHEAGTNKHPSGSVNLAKVDADSETLKVKTVDASISKAIQQARQKAGKTQKELATEISERPQVVTEYESGKAIPNQQILAKLERALKVKLRGANIGAPL
jgi:putative transcription factor